MIHILKLKMQKLLGPQVGPRPLVYRLKHLLTNPNEQIRPSIFSDKDISFHYNFITTFRTLELCCSMFFALRGLFHKHLYFVLVNRVECILGSNYARYIS